MKRIIILIASAFLMLSGALSLNAQTIIGSWTTTQSEKSDDKTSGLDLSANVADTLTFFNGGKYIEKMGMSIKMASGAEDYSFTLFFTINGTWTQEGNTIKTIFPKKGIKADVSSTDLPKILLNMIKNSLTKEMKESAGQETVYTIEKLTDSSMTLKSYDEDGEVDTTTYKRVR